VPIVLFLLMNIAVANELAGEKSPYLLQHKDNPVAWQPWGEKAFAQAGREGKPVFLSIGYSTCHWCHVMAHESFEDAATAKLMNEHFINIKVDREERPDVDRVYMAYVQATTGSGGWPMSVWLTPEGKPFFGGTYFPPETRYGRMGFPEILQKIADVWQHDRARIEEEGQRVVAMLQESSVAEAPGSVDADVATRAATAFARSFDKDLGGFGGAPKFPRPSVFNFLVRQGSASQAMVFKTLREMTWGGMRDQLGGGYHRYSVDEFWHVPHFEKMLYDQAQITVALVEAWQITKDAFFAEAARSTLDYVLRDLRHPDGGFFSAEDADSLLAHGSKDHAEGAFYVWDLTEIRDALDKQAAEIFCFHYFVKPNGNAPEGSDPHQEFTGKNILKSRASHAETASYFEKSEREIVDSLAASEAILLARRAKRPRPHLDDKILTAWNGLMISAFAKAGAALREPRYLAAAHKAADFLRAHLMNSDGLLRSWREGPSAIPGFAEDYAFVIQGFLDLYEADFRLEDLEQAISLQGQQDTAFWDEIGGSYFSSRDGDKLLPVRMKEDYDGAEPSSNSVSALNLIRLSRLLHNDAFSTKARRILASHAATLTQNPTTVPQMLVAWDLANRAPSQAIVVGSRTDAEKLLRTMQESFRPDAATILLDSKEATAFFSKNAPEVGTMSMLNGEATLYLCENFSCQKPVTQFLPK